jgi:6-pyruvoyl-tetrahydropterin synthase
MKREPLRTELLLRSQFEASHSLDVRESPHPHVWKVELTLGGEAQDHGKLVNLPTLQGALESVIGPLSGTYLNDQTLLPIFAREFPTCETLAAYLYSELETVIEKNFRSRNPTLILISMMVTLCDPDGREWGSARVYAP